MGYAEDSFFTLGPGGRIGLVLLSAVLMILCAALVWTLVSGLGRVLGATPLLCRENEFCYQKYVRLESQKLLGNHIWRLCQQLIDNIMNEANEIIASRLAGIA